MSSQAGKPGVTGRSSCSRVWPRVGPSQPPRWKRTSTRWAELMAAATMFTVPIILIFFLAQKTFIQGIATTGQKG